MLRRNEIRYWQSVPLFSTLNYRIWVFQSKSDVQYCFFANDHIHDLDIRTLVKAQTHCKYVVCFIFLVSGIFRTHDPNMA